MVIFGIVTNRKSHQVTKFSFFFMPKILLVEDDPMISDIYETKFRSSGFEVDVATNGKMVLQKVRGTQYDLVLLDLVLPEMGGMDVLRELRTNKMYDPSLKVVIFSNLGEREEREKALDLGANGFIPKTEYSPSRLVEEVSRFLRQFKERDKNLSLQAGMSIGVVPTGKKILFIEDEEVFTDMFGHRLEQEGYEVVYFDGDPEKVRQALDQPFDLVITDMIIRGMDGMEVIEMVRASKQNTQTPIILFSASVDDIEAKQAEERGATKYFLKTRLAPSELAREVNLLLEHVEEVALR